jgi:DNA recombination protein RmuC
MPETLIIALALLFLVAIVILLVTLPGRLRQTEPLLRLEAQLGSVKENLDRVERTLREELARAREEAATGDRYSREELSSGLASFGDQLSRLLQTLTQTSEEKLERMRATVEERLRALQDENSLRLEKMRETVDEKLHATLEQRLGDAFQRVSERLEQVREGLGEMKRTRGTFGEVQLGNLLDQVLTGEQYAQNVATRAGSNERVEFAIRLPGKDDQGSAVWLPIDAKFPQEDFQRLLEAQEQANPAALEEASRMLEVRIKNEARSIRDKYLDPPHTTDFGIMFLPTEGLFAEVIRRPGLFDQLQREFHVVVTGPTTLLAVLNSLQMGFRTLAIERRTSEVWSLLGAVKTEFGRFGEVLDKTQKKLQEASNTIETAATRSRAIERKLKNVQELPQEQAVRLLGPEEPDGDET